MRGSPAEGTGQQMVRSTNGTRGRAKETEREPSGSSLLTPQDLYVHGWAYLMPPEHLLDPERFVFQAADVLGDGTVSLNGQCMRGRRC